MPIRELESISGAKASLAPGVSTICRGGNVQNQFLTKQVKVKPMARANPKRYSSEKTKLRRQTVS